MTKSVKKFRLINTIEGYSFLILLFIAMPLKYILGFTIAVKIAGTIHGALFALFLGFLVLAWRESKWAFGETSLFFIASLIPFGTFYTKKRIKSYE